MRAAVLASVAVLMLLLGSCTAGIPALELATWLVWIEKEVALGAAFPLVVVRVHAADLEPDAFDDASLAPLVVRLEDVSRRTSASGFSEEIRIYTAYAFNLGAVTVSAPLITARAASGGAPRTAKGAPLSLRVIPLLDPRTPGPPEMLAEILPAPRRWPLWLALITAIATALAFATRARRRAPATAGPDRDAGELDARLRALRASTPQTPADAIAWHVEAAAIVRDHLALRHRIPARERTSEEILAAAPPDGRSALRTILVPCDLVKFARAPSSASDRVRIVAAIEQLVAAPSPAEGRAA